MQNAMSAVREARDAECGVRYGWGVRDVECDVRYVGM